MGILARFVEVRMKLATFIVAAVVHAQDEEKKKPEKPERKPLPVNENGENKASMWGTIGSSGTSCTQQGANVISTSDGYSGTVTIDNYQNNLHCYVNFGEECPADGVSVEFTHLHLETFNSYEWYDYDMWTGNWYYYGEEYEGCFDSIHFAWTENGEPKQ